MDAMPCKELIAEELINSEGKCCAIGVVCKSRNLDVSEVDYEDAESVGNVVGIAQSMAAEIEYINDDDFAWSEETPSERWNRVRKWIADNMINGGTHSRRELDMYHYSEENPASVDRGK